MRTHGRGGGLTVRSGDAEGVFIALHNCAPRLRTLVNGDTQLPCTDDLRVIVVSGGGADDKIRVLRDVVAVVTNVNVYAKPAKMGGALALCNVGAADAEPAADEHLGKRRHGNATYTDEMTVTMTV